MLNVPVIMLVIILVSIFDIFLLQFRITFYFLCMIVVGYRTQNAVNDKGKILYWSEYWISQKYKCFHIMVQSKRNALRLL